MAPEPHYIDVDLKKDTNYKLFSVTQNDTDVTLIVRVSDNGLITDTLLNNFTTVTLASERPIDRKSFYVIGEKITGTNEVEFKLGTSELANVGTVNASVQLYSTDGRVSTAHFSYKVRKDHTGDHVPTENEASLIETVLITGPRILTDAEAATAAAITATSNLEADKAAALNEMSTATEGANTAAANADNERVRMVAEVTQTVTDVEGLTTYIQDDFLPNTALALSDMDLVVQENASIANAAKTTAEDVEAQFNLITSEGPVQSVNGQTGIINGLALQSDLNQTNATLADTEMLTGSSPSAFWVAPPQPAARIDIPGYFTNGFAGTADDYINTLFEPLRASHGDYITRQNLGKDQSGLHDVWRYDFTPPNYEKTIIVTSTIHGGENQSTLAFYLFMKQVCENWKDYPQLAYLRQKVRIISIPIANPWGLSQAPRVRANVNGVNLNRNFDYKWDAYITYTPGHADYKGTAVWSEKETQYIRDLVAQYSDSVAYLDLHALGSGSGKKAYLYSPRSYNIGDESTWREFFEWFTKGQPYRWMMVENPMSCNWASKEFGMYASTPEWVTGEWGTQTFDAVEMTKSTEFFGNIILMFAQKYKTPKITKTTEPVLHRANYLGSNPSPLQITGNTYVAVPELALEFEVPTSGILMINGEISVKSDTATSISYIMPTVGQPGGLIEPGQLLEAYYGIYYEGDKRTTNPISAAFPVKPDNGDGTNKVKVQLWARTNLGILSIYRYRLNVLFIPSERTDSVKMYSATGGEGTGEGAMKIIQNGFS